MRAAKERVLLVDDEPQVLVALEDLLADDYAVLTSPSAEEALETMGREHDIAVLITDQRMPHMTGHELLAQLGDMTDTTRILLTGFADLSAVIRAVNEGKIFAYVTKPWNPEDLRLKVRKAAEHFRLSKELTHERQLLHDLMNNTPDGIYFKDRQLRFTRVNDAFARMVGFAGAGQLLGRRASDLMPQGAVVETEERRLLAERTPALDLVREVSGSGAPRWLSETKAPIQSHEGDVIGLVGIARDVTERVLTSEALRSSEQRFRDQSLILNSVLAGMGEGVVVIDRKGRFLLFNARAETILGLGPREVLPAELAQAYGLYAADQKTLLSPAENPLLQALSGKEYSEQEVFVKNSAVAGANVAITATPLRAEAEVVGSIALLRDVTQQRHLERQLIQAQKMEAIGRLAGGGAHDFNNLLSVIQSYGELTLKELPPGDSKSDDVAQMLDAVQRGAALTRQLLSFSRRQVIQPKSLMLNEVVADMDKMLRRIIGEDIALVTVLSPTLGSVKADTSQIEQVILNLAVNARDAMPRGGKLTIETQNVRVDARYALAHPGVQPGDFVLLAVADTGVGMDAETQKRLFEPFFTTKEVGKGTGLGLSTVYGIVQQSGGQIWLHSELGHGSLFHIYLPKGDAVAAPTKSNVSLAPLPASHKTVLVVEDNEAVLQVAARILRGQGYRVLEARQVDEARKICADPSIHVHLLLSDVVMAESSGPTLAKELCKSRPEMRVLFMSGYVGGSASEHGGLSPDAAYLEKPFSPNSLSAKVREVLES